MNRLSHALLRLLPLALVCIPALALAQAKPEPEPEPEPEASSADTAGTEVELGDEGVADDDFSFDDSNGPAGSDENPNAPDSVFSESKEEAPKAAAPKADTGYPLELIYRPLTLPRGMSEVALEIPLDVDPTAVSANLRATYGITSEYQLGLRYGLGTYVDSDFATGKAVSVDAQYSFNDWIAAQLSVPLYLDPFALGLTLGAPMRFEFFDSMALLVGQDFLSFKLYRFLPNVNDAAENEGLVAKDEINELVPDGEINTTLGVEYQFQKDLALVVNFGTRAIDFNTNDAPVLLNAALLYSRSNMFDLGAKLGSDRLDDAGKTFGISVFAALRI